MEHIRAHRRISTNVVFTVRDANNDHVADFPTSASTTCSRVWFRCEGWSNTTAVHFLVWTRWSRTQFTRSGYSCFHAANSVPLDWNQDHIFEQSLAQMVNPNLGTAHLCSHPLNELCSQAGPCSVKTPRVYNPSSPEKGRCKG